MANLTGFRDFAELSDNFVAVTTSDTVNLPALTRAIYVGVAGNITMINRDGTAVLLKSVPVGLHRIATRRINATATAATDIVAFF